MEETERTKTINVEVYRFNPRTDAGPHYQTYEVPIIEGMSVLNVLNYIYEKLDRSLAYYTSCRIGRGTGCAMVINGKVEYSCIALAEGDLKLEPLQEYVVVKDLMVDRSKTKQAPKRMDRLFGARR